MNPRYRRRSYEGHGAFIIQSSANYFLAKDLVAFHYDRSFVLDALRQGEIDCLEHVPEAAEADLVPSPDPARTPP
jgi:hypothetical protein